jgi:hypothetical protein
MQSNPTSLSIAGVSEWLEGSNALPNYSCSKLVLLLLPSLLLHTHYTVLIGYAEDVVFLAHSPEFWRC